MKKRCGGCHHWTKWKKDQLGGGLCELHDSRSSSDGKCQDWRPEKYKRERFDIGVEYE